MFDPLSAQAGLENDNVFNYEIINMPFTIKEVESFQDNDEVVPVINLQPVPTHELSTVANIPTVVDMEICSPSSKENVQPDEMADETLLKTIVASMSPDSLRPLIKEELKYTIQSRRMAEGKGELQVSFENPQNFELTEDEKLQVKRRREQNRLAAQKFRNKQKDIASRLTKKIQKLESKNTSLSMDLKCLLAEKEELVRRFREHVAVCPHIQLKS